MKTILFSICILSTTLSFTPKKGNPPLEISKLSGVVTYKELNTAYRFDGGSEIYVISDAEAKKLQYGEIANVIRNFQSYKSRYDVSLSNTVDPEKVRSIRETFNTTSDRTNAYIEGFKHLPSVAHMGTNDRGVYTFNLKPGKYHLLIISGHVKSNNTTELKGNVDYREVNIKAPGETFQNVHFEQQEMLWIKIVTTLPQNGC